MRPRYRRAGSVPRGGGSGSGSGSPRLPVPVPGGSGSAGSAAQLAAGFSFSFSFVWGAGTHVCAEPAPLHARRRLSALRGCRGSPGGPRRAGLSRASAGRPAGGSKRPGAEPGCGGCGQAGDRRPGPPLSPPAGTGVGSWGTWGRRARPHEAVVAVSFRPEIPLASLLNASSQTRAKEETGRGEFHGLVWNGVEILEMDLLGDCLPMGLDAQVTVKGLVAFLVNLLLMTVGSEGVL